MTERHIDLEHASTGIAVVFLIFAIAVYMVSDGFPGGQTGAPGAGFFPQIIAVCIGTLALVEIAMTVTTDHSVSRSIGSTDIVKFAVPVVGLILYSYLFQYVGFLLGTTLFLFMIMRYSGVESYVSCFLVSIVSSITLFYIFGDFLSVPLPTGVVPFEQFLPSLPLLTGGF